MKFGVQLYSLRERAAKAGAEEVLRLVSEAGYDGVELYDFYGKTPEELKDLLERYKLRAISAHIRPEGIEGCLPYIDALGMRYVFVPWVGKEEFETPEKYAALVSVTKRVKGFLDERGVVLGYHNHAHEYEGGSDYIVKFTDDAGIKAELDVFWAHVAGKNAVAEMRRLADRLALVHVKEAAAENPAENPQPIVGEGAVGMEGVFAEAKAQNIPWAILEVEQYPCGEEEYLAKSLENMKKLAKRR